MATPARAESRLATLSYRALQDRLELARASLRMGKTPFCRKNAIADIEQIGAELKRRGYVVT